MDENMMFFGSLTVARYGHYSTNVSFQSRSALSSLNITAVTVNVKLCQSTAHELFMCSPHQSLPIKTFRLTSTCNVKALI